MKSNYEKLRDLLKELFQLDQADLDFGIYRIMNQKRDEITRFLENDLLPQVQESFKEFRSLDRAVIKQELDETIQNAIDAEFDPEQSPKVRKLREKLAYRGVDINALENEVFSDLYNFFRRYYQEGDFLSLRRYKEGVYAIPYEGEEVKLYWANHDQYYIKTSEYFRDYTFKLSSGKHVHFKLIEADTEKDNTKAQNGKERRFILCEEEPFVERLGDGETGGRGDGETELFIRFEYRSDPDKRAQKDLNAQAIDTILNAKGFIEWRAELARICPSPTNPKRTILEKRLNDYTARNTFDYFIHKDLGKFLRRELDFYIKNEVMYLDDIENESIPRVEQYLSKIKVIRRIAHKIIDFLAQIENFQKKLWLKKKFVVETNYCVTLDRVPEELYPEIAANDAQREEWVRLFGIDEIKAITVPDYSVPLTVEFLKANPYLVMDTKFFGEDFKDKLLVKFDALETEIDGLVIQSENFQALHLLVECYRNSIKAIYIDPPYNTKKDIFPYKDGYKDSSWLSMIKDRLTLTLPLLKPDGVLFSSIDKHEMSNLSILLANTFGADNYVGEIVWRNARDNNPTQIAIEHEYIICFARDIGNVEPVWKNEFADAKELLLTEYNRLKSQNLNPETIQAGIRDFIKNNAEVLAEIDRYKFVDEHGIYTGSQSVHNPHPGGYEYEIPHPQTKKPMRMPANGYRFPYETMKREFIDKNKLIYGPDENRIVQIKLYLKEYQDSLRSLINLDGRLGAYALNDLFGSIAVYDNPKPPQMVKRLISFGSSPNAIVLDFFAGSGSTIQASIEIGRQSNIRIKYLAVEMADYFDTVLIPRIKKVIYSKDWKDGKPVSREGSSHMFKYIRLESYEDTLNNLELRRTKSQQLLLNDSPPFRESYMLSYMLDVESRGSASLLNIDSFEDPFNYKLNIANGSVGEIKPVTVDLVETFNYLLGLTVHHIDSIHGFRVVQGTSPKGEKALVIWRNLKEKSNEALDEFFRRQEYNPKDQEYNPKDMDYDLIYVNGDNNLENIRRENETWKVRLIEEEFQRLMFDVEDIC